MNKLSGILASLLLSTAANATTLNYGGHLLFDVGNFHAGDSFSGQITLDALFPDASAYQVPPTVSRPRLELTYLTNQSSSVAINNGPVMTGNDKLEVHFENDLELTQNMINSVGLQGLIAPGVYDVADAGDTSHDPASTTYTSYSILALFAANSFSELDIETQNYSGIMNLDLQPLFLGFSIIDSSSSAVARGRIETFNIAAVPLPSAVWLFGSVCAGLTLLRKRA